jgi:hypothetical protein
MHAQFRKGYVLVGSAVPEKPTVGLKITAAEVEEHNCKPAKKALTPSQIVEILRDLHSIGPNSMQLVVNDHQHFLWTKCRGCKCTRKDT